MKTALVTGASGGIGQAIAKALAEQGMRVIASYNTGSAEAFKLAENIGAEALMADISDEESVNKMAAEIEKKYGGVDVLVNNAGISMQKMLCDTTSADWDRIFSVNIRGTFLVTRALMGNMVRNHYGRIVNVSSVWGQEGASCEVAYSASKAAVEGFTKALAKELSLSGICVNCVAPGVIDTKMNAFLSEEEMSELESIIPMGRLGTPDEIAKVVAFLCSEQAGYITGQIIGVNGGFYI